MGKVCAFGLPDTKVSDASIIRNNFTAWGSVLVYLSGGFFSEVRNQLHCKVTYSGAKKMVISASTTNTRKGTWTSTVSNGLFERVRINYANYYG